MGEFSKTSSLPLSVSRAPNYKMASGERTLTEGVVMKTAVDFWGNAITVGDEVAIILNNYRTHVNGRIKSLTPKTAVVVFIHPTYNWEEETRRDHYDLIKKPTTS